MTKRMAEIQYLTEAGIARIGGDERSLNLDRSSDHLLHLRARNERLQTPQVRFVGNHAMLNHLGVAFGDPIVRKRPQQIRIAVHCRRLPECAGEILTLRKVDARFPADRRIDRGQERRRDLKKTDPAQVNRRGKASQIARDAAAKRQNEIASGTGW